MLWDRTGFRRSTTTPICRTSGVVSRRACGGCRQSSWGFHMQPSKKIRIWATGSPKVRQSSTTSGKIHPSGSGSCRLLTYILGPFIWIPNAHLSHESSIQIALPTTRRRCTCLRRATHRSATTSCSELDDVCARAYTSPSARSSSGSRGWYGDSTSHPALDPMVSQYNTTSMTSWVGSPSSLDITRALSRLGVRRGRRLYDLRQETVRRCWIMTRGSGKDRLKGWLLVLGYLRRLMREQDRWQ